VLPFYRDTVCNRRVFACVSHLSSHQLWKFSRNLVTQTYADIPTFHHLTSQSYDDPIRLWIRLPHWKEDHEELLITGGMGSNGGACPQLGTNMSTVGTLLPVHY